MDDWFKDAACRDSFDLRFFGSQSEQVEVRREFCLDCPVKYECRSLAELSGASRGVWGGLRMKWRG